MDQILKSILDDLKQKQSRHRYHHTIGVMYTAAALCMRYDTDIKKGMLAGALHDCGKLADIKNYALECEKYGIPVSDEDLLAPQLIHGVLGAYFAQFQYGITDSDILHAVKVHTTGCPNMSLLDKIVFVADYIEPERDHAPNLKELRKLAFEDLDKCIVIILEQTLDYLKRKEYYIGKATIDTYHYYKQ